MGKRKRFGRGKSEGGWSPARSRSELSLPTAKFLSSMFHEGDLANDLASVPPRCRYDIALLYLNQAKYDLDAAVETYLADEKWEKAHPMEASSKGKTKQTSSRRRIGVHTGLTGQL